MSTAPSRRVTPEEYLAFERRASEKHEYRDGEIVAMAEIGRDGPAVAMAGARRKHNLVSGNLFSGIHDQLVERPCEVYMGEMRVRTSWHGLYAYPDVVVVCGEPSFADAEFDTLLNPTVLIEVLSPSTESYDRGQKFEHYRRIDSLREYVLVAQDRMSVERFARRDDGWLLTGTLREPADVLRLESIGVAIPLSNIYAKVKFPEGTSDERPPP